MTSIKPLNWESPSTLVKSTLKGYKARLFHQRQYLLGHLVVRLESPLIGGTVYSAMVSASMREKRVLMLKEQIGLGILGISMAGELDSDKDIRKDLKVFSRLDKLAYVKYKMSEESARRIILFMEGFNQAEDNEPPPSSYYGGAFWPRYLNEGSGCSAYGLSMLDVAGLMGEEHERWKVNVNIPMDLVGGQLNNGKKVSTKEILKSETWVVRDSTPDQIYIPFHIYDPTIIYDWVMEQRSKTTNGHYAMEEENEIPGLVSDMSHIRPAVEDPVFLLRPEPSVFIEYFERTRAKGEVISITPDDETEISSGIPEKLPVPEQFN